MILDTNALSAFLDGDQAVAALLARADSVEIPVIVLGEYRFGIAQSRYRQRYEEELERLQQHCAVLPIESETSRHYAELRRVLKAAGTPIPANDLWIAALAQQHDKAVLTRDGHYDAVVGIQRIDWTWSKR